MRVSVNLFLYNAVIQINSPYFSQRDFGQTYAVTAVTANVGVTDTLTVITVYGNGIRTARGTEDKGVYLCLDGLFYFKRKSIPKEPMTGGSISAIVTASTVTASVGGFALFWFIIKKKSLSELIALLIK